MKHLQRLWPQVASHFGTTVYVDRHGTVVVRIWRTRMIVNAVGRAESQPFKLGGANH